MNTIDGNSSATQQLISGMDVRLATLEASMTKDDNTNGYFLEGNKEERLLKSFPFRSLRNGKSARHCLEVSSAP